MASTQLTGRWSVPRWEEVDTVAPGHRNYLFSTSPMAAHTKAGTRQRSAV